MQFEIRHELDAPVDAVERALMSPRLGPLLGRSLASLESVTALAHEVAGREFRRVWRFQAKAPLPILRRRDVAREMLSWDEHSTYHLDERAADWFVLPRGDGDPEAPWRRHFRAAGRYRLEPLPNGHTRRTVTGAMEVRIALIGAVVERLAVAELGKAYDAEQAALCELCA